MRATSLVIGVVAVVAVVAVVGAFLVFGYTSAPFDVSGEAAAGQTKNGFGDHYTLDAASLTARWTFTRDADAVLRFDDGSLSLDGTSLDIGCYSGSIAKGSVLAISDGRHVHFSSPDADAACHPMP